MVLASLYPDRISVRYEGNRLPSSVNVMNSRIDSYSKSIENKTKFNEKSLLNLKIKKTKLVLSKSSQRKIRDSSNLIYALSPKRTVKVNKKLTIYNYRSSFITLTLPSSQIHKDVEIKRCLNNFLQSMREQENLKNYVWKAELQKNENIHFHIITDIFVAVNDLKRYWNKAINKLGYVDRYQEKMKALNYKEYAALRGVNDERVRKAYKKGLATDWSSPNSIDIKSVVTANQMSFYLSKYMGKQNEANIDVERCLSFGRIWSRSQSVSSIKVITRYLFEDLKGYLGESLKDKRNFFKREYEWNTTYYVNFKTVDKKVLSWLTRKMVELGITYNYPFVLRV